MGTRHSPRRPRHRQGPHLMEWYESSLGGDDYDATAYTRLLVRLATLGLLVGLVMAAGSAW